MTKYNDGDEPDRWSDEAERLADSPHAPSINSALRNAHWQGRQEGVKSTKVDGYIDETWTEFDRSGLLWVVNNALNPLGWAIAMQVDTESGELIKVLPVRLKQRTPECDRAGRSALVDMLRRL